MSVFSGLSIEDRAEIDAAIRVSYDEGSSTLAGAVEEFLDWMASATQAHREYADALRGEWELAGATKFVRERWGSMRHVHFRRADGSTEVRPGNRGTLRVNELGRQQWEAKPLDLWDTDRLQRGIADCVRRIETERTTIANYRRLLDLLETTGCTFVHEGLAAVGQTLDEFLTADSASA